MKVLAVMLSLLAAPVAAADKISFTTEDYPPYNFRAGSEIKGAGYDQLIELMKEVDATYTIEMMPWARAISLAQTEPMHCVFTAAHIPERDKLFKWLEPIAVGRNFMISRKGSGIDVKNNDDAKSYIVGTQRNDYTQTLLENSGFRSIDLATDLNLTLKKLVSGRIDLMPIDEQHYIELAKSGEPIEVKFIFTQQKFSVACNPGFPDALLQQMQAALDKLIENGTQAMILEKYGLKSANIGVAAATP